MCGTQNVTNTNDDSINVQCEPDDIFYEHGEYDDVLYGYEYCGNNNRYNRGRGRNNNISSRGNFNNNNSRGAFRGNNNTNNRGGY